MAIIFFTSMISKNLRSFNQNVLFHPVDCRDERLRIIIQISSKLLTQSRIKEDNNERNKGRDI